MSTKENEKISEMVVEVIHRAYQDEDFLKEIAPYVLSKEIHYMWQKGNYTSDIFEDAMVYVSEKLEESLREDKSPPSSLTVDDVKDFTLRLYHIRELANDRIVGTKYMTVKQAAQYLNVSMQTLRNWDNAKKLRAFRHPMNNYRIYFKTELDKLKLALTNLEKQKEKDE